MQATWQSLGSIKASEVARMAVGVVALKVELLDYARIHNGAFFIYGSIAKGALRYDSDIDVLVDFPTETISDAWRFCEDACRKHGLKPDVRPRNFCSPKFLEKALVGAVELNCEG
jgi:predicted nucleotidyltransferase